MKPIKNLILCTCISILLLLFSCSKDSDNNETNNGSFNYTVSGAISKTITGTNTNFGVTNSFGQTFIRLVVDSDILEIRIVKDPIIASAYSINPVVTLDENNQIINHPIEENDSFATFNTGSTLTGDNRNFSSNSANGGIVTITSEDENSIKGTFNISLMELIGGSGNVFNNPKINLQGSFEAVKN